ncbi:MAG: hypothetical protein EAX96_02555 [Candidatus Lokiarchaeota archaeon]|nr:hypothetical protein [Candidatus Lokiarchaeota archaeon]
MIIAERFEFNEISSNWKGFEKKLKDLDEISPRIEITNILWPEDGFIIELSSKEEYKIYMTFNLHIKQNREYILLINNAKIILLLELGFKMDDNIVISQKLNKIAVTYYKKLKNINNLMEMLKNLDKQFHNFKLMVQMKENATYVFQNDTLNHLFPYIEKDISPKNRLVNSIVSALIDAYVDDRENQIPEVNCGKRTALKLVEEVEKIEKSKPAKERINWYPEKLYRILRKDEKIKKYKDISNEVYNFIEMVPYSGRGKRLEGSDCAVAYQIKKDNKYVSTKLNEVGIKLTVIFPGG